MKRKLYLLLVCVAILAALPVEDAMACGSHGGCGGGYGGYYGGGYYEGGFNRGYPYVGAGGVAFRRSRRLRRRARRAAYWGFYGRANRLNRRASWAFGRGMRRAYYW